MPIFSQVHPVLTGAEAPFFRTGYPRQAAGACRTVRNLSGSLHGAGGGGGGVGGGGVGGAVVNTGGEEPLMEPKVFDAVAGGVAGAEMPTAATPLRAPEEYDNPNVVKVVVNAAGRALYFSRRTIPYLREAASRSVSEQLAAFPFLKHLGIYGYRREKRLWRGWIAPLPLGAVANTRELCS